MQKGADANATVSCFCSWMFESGDTLTSEFDIFEKIHAKMRPAVLNHGCHFILRNFFYHDTQKQHWVRPNLQYIYSDLS